MVFLAGVEQAVAALSVEGGADAAAAIMTTDTVPKVATVTVDGFTIGGMAKGAGMLAPALATMLVVLTTDAVINEDRLREVVVLAQGSSEAMQEMIEELLGTDWDDELEVFRHAGQDSAVVWLHKVG